ncbi:hypothetical protein ACIOZM_26480 [Pseudomonas sp. NPDC087346]|uniref:hypothetical protein n=1 Tax=Pseudomonas sp. NPDC087346 TaxID=3364438 RepID=UPI00380CF8BE
MSSESKPHPREITFTTLEQQIEEYFAAGHTVQKIPSGLSGQTMPGLVSAHHLQLQKERAKLAPALQKQAETGKTIGAAARALKIKVARARLIATENAIKFAARERTKESSQPPALPKP